MKSDVQKWLAPGAASAYFLYAVLVFLLGVLLPALSHKYALHAAEKGMLFLVLNLAILITVCGAGLLMERFGKKPVLLTGTFLVVLALLGMGRSEQLHGLLIMLFVLGLGAGCVNIGVNTLIPDLYPQNPSRALNLANVFFALGAICMPLLGSFLLGPLGLRGFLGLIAGLAVIPLALFGVSRFPPSRHMDSFRVQDFSKVLADPLFFMLALVLFFYVALEISTAGWLKEYFMRALGLQDRQAGYILSLFSGLLVVGRLLAGFVLKIMHGTILVLICSFIVVVGLVLIVASHGISLACLGVMLIGIAYAPIFPTSLGTASDSFANHQTSIFGVLIACGILGSVLLPMLIGLLGGDLRVMIVAAALMLFAQVFVMRLVRRRRLAARLASPGAPASTSR